MNVFVDFIFISYFFLVVEDFSVLGICFGLGCRWCECSLVCMSGYVIFYIWVEI